MNEIKGDVQRMVKRRKDSGFTLIELMIVIAVIGILAVVLVPKVGGVKTSAKSAGVDTNIRAVQAYVESRISYWSTLTDTSTIKDDIEGALVTTPTNSDKLVNPFTGSSADALVFSAVPSDLTKGSKGAVYIVIPTTKALLVSNGIEITGIYGDSNTSSKVTVKP